MMTLIIQNSHSFPYTVNCRFSQICIKKLNLNARHIIIKDVYVKVRALFLLFFLLLLIIYLVLIRLIKYRERF